MRRTTSLPAINAVRFPKERFAMYGAFSTSNYMLTLPACTPTSTCSPTHAHPTCRHARADARQKHLISIRKKMYSQELDDSQRDDSPEHMRGWGLPRGTVGVHVALEKSADAEGQRTRRLELLDKIISHTGVRHVMLAFTSSHMRYGHAMVNMTMESCQAERGALLASLSTPVKVKCLPASSARAEGGGKADPILYTLSATLLLSRADYLVGRLSSDLGRTVHELMQARACCNPWAACLPSFFDVDSPGVIRAWAADTRSRPRTR